LTYTYNKALQCSFRDFVKDQESHYFITANFNRDTNLNAARKSLGHWSARIDRMLLGKNWYKKNTDERVFFIACAHHLHSNMHWHLMLRLPQDGMRKNFLFNARDYWKQIVKSGRMDIQSVLSEKDKKLTSMYATGETWQPENYNAFIFSTEFSSRYNDDQ
jgi:hypothetical protein